MPIAPPLGRILAYLRERKGLLKKELARLLGYKDETLISRYESGLKELSREKLEEMLEPLDTPPEAVDVLLFAEDPRSSATSCPTHRQLRRATPLLWPAFQHGCRALRP